MQRFEKEILKAQEEQKLRVENSISTPIEDYLEKARTHKYFKREGSPGNYKYYYTKEEYNKAKGIKSESNKDINNKYEIVNKVESFIDEDTGEIVTINVNRRRLVRTKENKEAEENKLFKLYNEVNNALEKYKFADNKLSNMLYEKNQLTEEYNNLKQDKKQLLVDMEEGLGNLEGSNMNINTQEYGDKLDTINSNILSVENKINNYKKKINKLSEDSEKLYDKYLSVEEVYEKYKKEIKDKYAWESVDDIKNK